MSGICVGDEEVGVGRARGSMRLEYPTYLSGVFESAVATTSNFASLASGALESINTVMMIAMQLEAEAGLPRLPLEQCGMQ